MTPPFVLVVGSVDLVKGRHRNTARVGLKVRNVLNAALLEMGWPGTAPFEVVSLIIRFGEKAMDAVEVRPVSTRQGKTVLDVAVQLSMSDIVAAQTSDTLIEELLMPAVSRAVNVVADTYELPPYVAQQAVQGDGPASGGSAP